MEAVGLASACVSANLNNKSLLKYKMKIQYPIVCYILLNKADDLENKIIDLRDRAFTTYLLKKQLYVLESFRETLKSIQIIGIEENVEIDIGPGLLIHRPEKSNFNIDYEPEDVINIYFENVHFLKGHQLVVGNNAKATFFRCKFQNGIKACDKYPRCKGENGCVKPFKCKKRATEIALDLDNYVGEKGSTGFVTCEGGNSYLERCTFNRCGGGGIFCSGNTSYIKMKQCSISNMRGEGITVENSGTIVAQDCSIVDNQCDGIHIRTKGVGIIQKCDIRQNGHIGIYCGGNVYMDDKRCAGFDTSGASRVDISECDISNNGLSGIDLIGGSYVISGNRIFENWHWGIMIKSRSVVNLSNNDIFKNKCGGIRIGLNYSASVLIDGYTIRDHTGPAIYSDILECFPSLDLFMSEPISDEVYRYSRKPFVTNRNILQRNDKGIQYPQNMFQLPTLCIFCNESFTHGSLKVCSQCRKASYCSKRCQRSHWQRHKNMCKLIRENCTVEIDMKTTTEEMFEEERLDEDSMMIGGVIKFHPSLKGIGEGIAPAKSRTERFVVKLQSGHEHTPYMISAKISLYDQSLAVRFKISNAQLYHLIHE